MPRSPRPRSAPGARVPAVVLVATVAFGALAALWSVAVPLLEAPDEPDHLALVLHLADGNPYPEFDGLQSQAAVYRMCRVYVSSIRACPRDDEVVSPTGMRRHPREQAPPKSERPAWDDLGGDEPVGALNQMPQHPPLYYQLMAGVLRVERAVNGGPWSLDRELALLRLANVALVTPLPLLAWWAARRFRLDQATAIGACFAVFAVPMLTHIGSTLNNDNLLNLCGALLVALLAGVLRGDRSLRTGLAVGAVIGVGLLTKAFAVIFPPLAVLAYAIGAVVDPDRPAWRESVARVARPLGAAGLVSIVLAGWWYVGVRLRTGSFTPTVEDAALTSALAPAGFEPRVGTFLGQFLPAVDTRFWGPTGGTRCGCRRGRLAPDRVGGGRRGERPRHPGGAGGGAGLRAGAAAGHGVVPRARGRPGRAGGGPLLGHLRHHVEARVRPGALPVRRAGRPGGAGGHGHPSGRRALDPLRPRGAGRRGAGARCAGRWPTTGVGPASALGARCAPWWPTADGPVRWWPSSASPQRCRRGRWPGPWWAWPGPTPTSPTPWTAAAGSTNPPGPRPRAGQEPGSRIGRSMTAADDDAAHPPAPPDDPVTEGAAVAAAPSPPIGPAPGAWPSSPPAWPRWPGPGRPWCCGSGTPRCACPSTPAPTPPSSR
ncbi:MAG: DUF2142 domain-containing protein [Acidimicrobiales bacterium]